jgi:putative PIN family toxin of toxin-antitoxin system
VIRAVLDTNLIVSYTLTKGVALSKVIHHWENGSFTFLTSPSIMEELRDVLLRPGLRSKMAVDPQALLEVIETDTERTPGMMALPGVCRDPKDDKFSPVLLKAKQTIL